MREHILTEIQNSGVPEIVDIFQLQLCKEVLCSHSHLGSLNSARVLQKKILEALDSELGQDHAHTIMAASSLAAIYHEHGLWKESEPLLLAAAEVYQKTLASFQDTYCELSNGAQPSTSQTLVACLPSRCILPRPFCSPARQLPSHGKQPQPTLVQHTLDNVGWSAKSTNNPQLEAYDAKHALFRRQLHGSVSGFYEGSMLLTLLSGELHCSRD